MLSLPDHLRRELVGLWSLVTVLRQLTTPSAKGRFLTAALGDRPYLAKYLRATYGPHKYHIHPACVAFGGQPPEGDRLELLQILNRARVAGGVELEQQFIHFLRRTPNEMKELVLGILERDLRCGIDARLIDNAFLPTGLAPLDATNPAE